MAAKEMSKTNRITKEKSDYILRPIFNHNKLAVAIEKVYRCSLSIFAACSTRSIAFWYVSLVPNANNNKESAATIIIKEQQ